MIISTITLALAMTACVPSRSTVEETIASVDTISTETQLMETELTVQETAAPTEAATEPAEAVPKATTAPAVNTGSYTNSNGSSSGSSTPDASGVIEQPAATPTQTPPAEPTPTEHTHSWQEVYHAEESHDVWWIVCQCGAKFATLDEMNAHSNAFLGSDGWLIMPDTESCMKQLSIPRPIPYGFALAVLPPILSPDTVKEPDCSPVWLLK